MGLNLAYFYRLQEFALFHAKAETKAPEKIAIVENKISAFAEALAAKISRLGISKEISLALAQKVEQGDFVPVKIKSGDEVSAILKEDTLGEAQPLSWPQDPSHVFEGKKYEVGGINLYRFESNKKEILFTKGFTKGG
jgi:hydrogenase maturation factor